MNIIKLGNADCDRGEFYFICGNCGCEWTANRGDDGLKISPPCVEFYTYMKCPCCKETAYDRFSRRRRTNNDQ